MTHTRGQTFAAALAAALAFSGAAVAEEIPAAFGEWLSGDWEDPKVHVCGQVWVRIIAEGDRFEVYTVTYGNPFYASTGRVLSVGGDGTARVYNEALGREQQIRFVTQDAHVLEKPERAAGVTFVRCDFEQAVPF